MADAPYAYYAAAPSIGAQSAFPGVVPGPGANGATLRVWLAGQALALFQGMPSETSLERAQIIARAYALADEMLALEEARHRSLTIPVEEKGERPE